MKHAWPLIGLCLLCPVAAFWPEWTLGSEIPDPFLSSKPAMKGLFAATMFIVGCLIPRDEFQRVLSDWPRVLGGTAIQYAVMPLLAWTIGRLSGIEGPLLIGIVLVGCVPGAMASNVITMTAGGNVSFSVSLTTSATLLSPLMVPLMLYFAVDVQGVDQRALMWKAFETLLYGVVGPVMLGRRAAMFLPELERLMKFIGPVVANAVILWIIAVVVAGNRANLTDASGQLIVVLLLINLGGYLAGWVGGRWLRLSDTRRRALTIEVGMQNAGLGAILAGELFEKEPLIALPPALYTFGCMLTGCLLAQLWSRLGTDPESSEAPLKGD